MRKILLMIFIIVLVTGCGPSVADDIELTIQSTKTQNIDFNDVLYIKYVFMNHGEERLSEEDYEITLSYARPKEASRTILAFVSEEVLERSTNPRTYEWNIDSIPGNGGDYVLYVTFSEKVDGGTITLQEASIPISFIKPEN